MNEDKRIAVFDGKALQELSTAVGVRLAGIEEMYGVLLEIGSLSWEGQKAKLAVNLKIDSTSGKLTNEDHFAKFCKPFGLRPDHLGSSFEYEGASYKVLGLQPDNSKFPIIVQASNGKRKAAPADVVRRALMGDLKEEEKRSRKRSMKVVVKSVKPKTKEKFTKGDTVWWVARGPDAKREGSEGQTVFGTIMRVYKAEGKLEVLPKHREHRKAKLKKVRSLIRMVNVTKHSRTKA